MLNTVSFIRGSESGRMNEHFINFSHVPIIVLSWINSTELIEFGDINLAIKNCRKVVVAFLEINSETET